ncbi:MAG: protein translocase SEC61 complex subunit gamma [Candidatus Micrarchaeia archaeon]|jgi:protein translocase SEC61 complex gamma subunit
MEELKPKKPSIMQRLRQFYENSKHVFSISYKPSMSEFKRTLKIVLIGTLLIGTLGYIISLIIGLLV